MSIIYRCDDGYKQFLYEAAEANNTMCETFPMYEILLRKEASYNPNKKVTFLQTKSTVDFQYVCQGHWHPDRGP